MVGTFKLPFKPKCPQCSAILDGATNDKDNQPKDGDITICAYCLETLIFEGEILRVLTAVDMENLGDEVLMEISRYANIAKKIEFTR